ncbi:hypothetical protein [Sorangium cellulosum]|uniref:Uncharacterized protein n=1 Tax=Sorangium cellulosum So0157-2 TaxID=1254432 RepID=S4Y8H9_SORCE|nr:hypothetical protein [Sorangium cellulosum]AGP39168.1 hypothetical protein SCE1572_34610 [Sorangium cellulosum So0157-2]
MNAHRELFDSVRRRTGMYFPEQTYFVVAAFVLGYDMAHAGGVLAGFREWLVLRLGMGSNLTWMMLVLHAAFPEESNPHDVVIASPTAQRQAIDILFDLIDEFHEVRAERDGLRKLFVSYDCWVRQQGIE